MNYTELHINRVYLMLGGQCNYKCRHCVQAKSDIESGGEGDKAFDYIKHLAKIKPPQIGKLTVMFWGGEPLLYFEKIKMTVEKLGDSVEYAMVSNGSLLTEDIVDFCNENNVLYVLSNDGPYTERVRGENLLENEDFLQLFLRIKRRAVDSVISAYNQDYYVLWEYIEMKAPGTPVYTELLECTWDMPDDLYSFDFNAYRNMMEKVVKKARADVLKGEISREVKLLHSYAKDIMKIVEQGEKAFLLHPRCSQVRKSMNIDLDGNVYACHNFSDCIGTVDDAYETLLARYDAMFSLDNSCVNCEVSLLCRGGCPFAKAQGRRNCCEIRRIFIKACISYVSSFADTLEEVEV